MKTTSPSRQTGAFTLIELLVTMAIIATLAALVVGGLRIAQKRSYLKKTETQLGLIELGLESYKTDNGEFPFPAQEELTGSVSRGGNWNIGGAACLYQALLGDGNDMIRGYRVRDKQGETPGPSRGELGGTGGEVFLKDAASTKGWFENSGTNYFLIDGFGHPWQYKPFDPKNPNETENSDTFDLWSFGDLSTPSSSSEAKKSWVRNW